MMKEHSLKEVETVCKDIIGEDTSLLIATGESLQETIVDVVKSLLEAKYNGIYISLNKPHQTIDMILKDHDVKTDNLFYIDCITAAVHKIPHKKAGNVLYADHPSDLTKEGKVNKAIFDYVEKTPGNEFVVIDALRTMLLYNEPKLVAGFTHTLIQKAKEFNMKIVVLTRREHDEELIDRIIGYFDYITEVY